ncbi:MAG: DUF934 domain-containing protein [Hyphomicrobiales bacterium]|nr:DUF934 domain-containing protein [Hyphomicrobiales bacterium]MCY4054169.1 DUF934 domain-containing protein [Hyphomicrobiales bacterium]
MILRNINNRFEFGEDAFERIEDDAPVPATGAVLVSAARWLGEHDILAKRKEPVGVWIEGDGDLEGLGEKCAQLELIVLRFPVFKDGRAYSQARLLRERYGFKGELRATGNILRDQLAFMERCGFNAFELDERIGLSQFNEALAEISVYYQPTGDGRMPVYQLRTTQASPGQARAAA